MRGFADGKVVPQKNLPRIVKIKRDVYRGDIDGQTTQKLDSGTKASGGASDAA